MPQQSKERSGQARRRAWRHRPLRSAIAAVTALSLIAGAVWLASDSADPRVSGHSGDGTEGASAEGSARWPSERVRDWTGYADQFSLVTVLEEKELPPQPGADPRVDDGYVGRQVTLRVDRTFWRRAQAPGYAEGGTTVPVKALGWLRQEGGELVPFNVRGGPRIEVGQRYLIPLTRHDGGWSPVGHGAILTLQGGTVSSEVEGEPSAGARALKGKTIEEAGRIVAETPPDPAAAKYAERGPDARYDAASAESSE